MDEESCVDPLLVKMLRETTSEPETTGEVWIVYYYGVSKLVRLRIETPQSELQNEIPQKSKHFLGLTCNEWLE